MAYEEISTFLLFCLVVFQGERNRHAARKICPLFIWGMDHRPRFNCISYHFNLIHLLSI